MPTLATRAQLEAQLATLEARYERLHDHQRNRSRELSRDSEEQAVELQNEEVIEALLPKTRAEIAALKKAIARLDSGETIACAACGKPIDARRLAILPHTPTCAKCA